MSIWCILLCISLLAFNNMITAFADEENYTEVTKRSFDAHTTECPTWYLPAENDTSKCVCGNILSGKIKCLEGERVSMLVESCITYTEEQLVGVCRYVPSDGKLLKDLYITFPKNVSKVNEFMCGSLNRTGLLCSQCQEGLSLAAISYRRECVECSNPSKGIVLFIVLTFIPTTAFFLLVMMCSIDISSGPMNAVLVIVHVTLARVNQCPTTFLFKSANPLSYYPVLFLVTFYGIWNLDFLRYIIPPFCISKSLTSLQAEALEYVVAVYPLLLIVATYICVELYDNEYRIIVALWAPFRKMFRSECFKDLNIRYSLIKAFATFLVLSYTKIFHISRALLNYTEIKNITGDIVKTVLAIDASTSYSSATHIPYMVLATFMLVTFNLLPLFLLLLYPMKCFQVFLGKFPGVNWHPLRAFMDIFQGCYKNGTDGTRDCRYFAAFNFIVRIVSLFPYDNQGTSNIRTFVLLMVFIALVAISRPYQRNIFNIWEIFIYNVFLLDSIWILIAIFTEHHSLEILYLSHFILLTYVCFLCVVKISKTLSPRCYNACVDRIKRLIEKCNSFPCCYYQQDANVADLMERGAVNLSASQEMDEEYPDRINNPQDYEPLLTQSTHNVIGNKHSVVLSYGITSST